MCSGCIDSYSRFILWLNVSNNNLAKTSHNYFAEAIQEHGAPIKMRSDKGNENRMIAKHIILVCQDNVGSCIGGRLIRNTRIKCF